jgi:hypothetical protein
MGRIVHDDRGAASVEWQDAPEDYQRPVLEIEAPGSRPRESRVRGGLDVLSIKNDDTFNPYDRSPEPAAGSGKGVEAKSGKRDLKKLSAWLKMMREMEERKKNGDDPED